MFRPAFLLSLLPLVCGGLTPSCVLVVGRPDDWTSQTLHGSGVLAQETRELTPFERVFVADGIELELEVGAASPAIVEGDDNLLQKLQVEVRGSELHLQLANGSYRTRHPLAVSVGTLRLTSLRVEGSAIARVRGVTGTRLAVEHRGSERVAIAGAVEELFVEAFGSGELDLSDLPCRQAEVVVLGRGDVSVRVSEHVTVELLGGADVTLFGSARLDVTSRGSGSIRRR